MYNYDHIYIYAKWTFAPLPANNLEIRICETTTCYFTHKPINLILFYLIKPCTERDLNYHYVVLESRMAEWGD